MKGQSSQEVLATLDLLAAKIDGVACGGNGKSQQKSRCDPGLVLQYIS